MPLGRRIMKNIKPNINPVPCLLILVLMLAVFPRPASADQDLPLDVRQIDISSKRQSHNSLIAAARDADGYLWFASIHGLYVHDGNLIRPVLEDVLQGTKIRDIHIDANSVLWVATNSGVLAHALKTGVSRWHRATGMAGDLASNTTHAIHEDQKGSIWIGTSNGGLHRYEPSFDTFQRVEALASGPDEGYAVLDLCEDRRRDMWLATDQGLLRLTGNQGPVRPIPLVSRQAYSARKIAFDGGGNLFVAVAGRGLWTLPAGARAQELLPVEDVPSKHISDLFTDQAGDVWICSSQGLFRFASRENRVLRHPLQVTSSYSKTPLNLASITETSPGTLWIGTYNHGVLHRAANPLAKLIELRIGPDMTNISDANVLCAVSPLDSRVYVGLRSGGLYRSAPMNPDRTVIPSQIDLQPVLESPKILAMAWDRDNALICGTDKALLRIDPRGAVERLPFTPHPDIPYYDNMICGIAPMDDGRIWFSNTVGVFSWQPGDATFRRELSVGDDGPLTAMTRSGSRLWFGHGQSIIALDTATRTKTRLELPNLAWAGDASAKSVSAIEDTLWIGTTRSLFRFEMTSGTLTQIRDSGGDSIPNVQSFWADPAGNVWAHTHEKIFQVPSRSERALAVVTGAEHPAASITSGPTLLAGQALIYGHSDGLLLVTPETAAARPKTRPKISEIRIFGAPLPASPLGRMPGSLELGQDQNYLSFTFSVPEPGDLSQPHFFYMLEGVDSAWNDAAGRNSVSYAHLRPGSYILHVKDGDDDAATTSMRILIHPPWWLTPWAKTGYALGIILVVLGASRLFASLQTARIRKEMLENLVMQDPLTGVPNRRKFKEVLTAEKSRCKRSNHQISVIMLDIDYFKGFNDRFGHQAGDKALRSVAQTLSATLRRPEDFVARYGGEEFVVVLPSTNRSGAERVARKIQDAIHEANIPYPGSPLSDRITVSLGISTFSPQTDLHIDSGLFSADQALYQAKRSGRNCFFYKDHCLSLTPLRQ
jgi:diguanylate cyclase (GGDEF)-like protein